MRRALAATVLLMGTTIAGCLAGDDAPTSPGADPDAWSAIYRFGANHDEAVPLNASLPEGAGLGTSNWVYSAHRGAEPNIGITSKGNVFVTALSETLRSMDRGTTWELVQNYSMLQSQSGAIKTSDPMLYVDPSTDRVWVTHMWSTNCFNMLWSDDEGETWTQRDGACVTPLVDHQKVVAGPPGPKETLFTANMPLHPSVLYTCYNNGAATTCFMSYDGGLTYPLQTDAITKNCGGVAGHPALAPDGTIAVAAGWNCGPVVAVSEDSGLTWTEHAGPKGGAGAAIDPDLAWSDDGKFLYLTWIGKNQHVWVARSPDKGKTWDAKWDVTAPGVVSTRFHVMNAGEPGKLGIAYLGTRYQTKGDEKWEGHKAHDAPPGALWHLYIVTAENATTDAPVFTSYQVTPENDPVQVGCSWESGGNGGERRCRNLLDFIDSTVHPDGTYWVVYTEGCVKWNGCAPLDPKNPPDEMEFSRKRETAVAWLDGFTLRKPGTARPSSLEADAPLIASGP